MTMNDSKIESASSNLAKNFDDVGPMIFLVIKLLTKKNELLMGRPERNIGRMLHGCIFIHIVPFLCDYNGMLREDL